MQQFRRRLADHYPFRLMKSAGGLGGAAFFVGKDSVLSGSAGGVIGCSKVAWQAGFEKTIGFDINIDKLFLSGDRTAPYSSYRAQPLVGC